MSILSRLQRIQNLPSVPAVVLELNALMRSGNTDAHRLADIVAHDPSLASTVLRVANSVHYTPASQRISSIQNAIVRLGFDALSQLALTIGLLRHFPDTSYRINHSLFWRHCISAAYLADEIAAHIEPRRLQGQREMIFTGGLLHDIGIIIYEQFLHDDFGRIVTHAQQERTTYLQAETNIVGADTHALAGGAFLELWKIGAAVVAGVRFHHDPLKAPESFRTLATILFLCEHTLCNSSMGSQEGIITTDPREAYNFLGLDANGWQRMLVDSQERIAQRSAVVARSVSA